MSILKKFIVLTILSILVGCGSNSGLNNSDPNQDVELTKISTKQSKIKQVEANKAKDILKENKHVTAVKAVNTDKKLLIAVEIPHHERFNMKKIRKDLTDDLKKQFSKHEIELSTDKKIILELEKLEKKLQEDSVNKKELEKEIKHIINLSKEQT